MVAELGEGLCPRGGLNRRHHPPLLEAFPAENGSPLGRAEGYGGLFVTTRTDRAGFDLVVDGRGGLPVAAKQGCALGLAELAAFGLVLELLVVEEQLLTGCEHKVIPTIDADQSFVLEFHRENTPSDGDCSFHDQAWVCPDGSWVDVAPSSPSCIGIALGSAQHTARTLHE